MSGPGQTFNAKRVMVVVVDQDDKVHGWDVDDGRARWRMTGVADGRSTVHIDIDGPMRRKTRDLSDVEMPELDWEQAAIDRQGNEG